MRLFRAISTSDRLLGAGVFALALTVPGVATAQITTPHDVIPDFCASPNISSIRSGSWSDPGTWSPARVPGGSDNVRVSAGTVVTFDAFMGGSVGCVGIDGTLTFSRATQTRLWTGNVMVYQAGTLDVGTTASPIPAGVYAEIVIANRALNLSIDPDQYGTALISLGRVRIHGAAKTPTWVRLATEPRAGQSTLTLAQAATGWQLGDRLVLPDTRHMKSTEVSNWSPTAPQWEELTVMGISLDGRTITLGQTLRWDHLGARDGDNALTFLPHVGNLTRNVVLRSEVPIGSGGTLGHVLLTRRTDVDIRYALFRDLGRTTNQPLNPTTNHIGRYALHMHHAVGPTAPQSNGYQFTLIGNAIDGGSGSHRLKWGVAIHNSHYGLIQGNVLYNWAGSLMTFEDGSESRNVLDGNFAMRSTGTGDRLSEATEGGGFWFKGPNNFVRNNVAANLWGDTTEAAYGFKYFMRMLGTVRIPNYQGADTSVTGQYTNTDGNRMKLLEFTNNEVYSAAQGVTYWWVNSQDPAPYAGAEESLMLNLRIWHVYNKAIYHYPSARITFDGLVIRGKDPGQAACCGQGFHGEDYSATNITIRNSDIQGMNVGVRPSTAGTGLQTVENSFLRNATNVQMITMYSANGPGWLPPRKTILRNTRFAAWPGTSGAAVRMNWDVTPNSNTTQRDEVLVYSFNNVASDNFRVYYSVQATQNVAGGLAPCTTTRSGIVGIVCPIPPEAGTTPPPAPAAPSNVRIIR
jgi:hypothetical protein